MVATRAKLTWLSLLGPGMVVMLADTDAGSLVLSAQSGAVWGYKLLLLQFILIPILFIAQELTVRLGLATGMGHGELIKHYFGKGWAWFSVSMLVICCVGALLTELSGLAAVGELFAIPVWETMAIVVAGLTMMAWTGSYHSIERLAIFIGIFELVFVVIAWCAKPNLNEMMHGMTTIPWHEPSYLYLVAGNIGAVIMPWMLFFQQSALLDKGLTIEHLKSARVDTLIGALLTQLIMASVLIFSAATVGKVTPNTSLNAITQINDAIVSATHPSYGSILFALGMSGAAIVASIVVLLTAAWSVGEVLGYKRSLEHHPKEAPWFYGVYTIILCLSAVLVASHVKNLVSINVAIEVMNALLLPIIFLFLFLLARKALPSQYALKGWYAYVVAIVLGITSVLAVLGGFMLL